MAELRSSTDHVRSRRSFGRRALCGLSFVMAGTLAFLGELPGITQTPAAGAQAASANTDIVGTWQGTLHAGRDLRLVVKVTKDEKGRYKVETYSIDQNPTPILADTASFQDKELEFAITMIEGKYDGKMSSDSNTIDGTWTQGGHPLPLNLSRATAETEWTIPKPPPPIPAMAEDANPSIEVATIKPSVPGRKGKGFGFSGREFKTINTDTYDLIAFAYGLDTKQIVGAPAWFDSDLYDVQLLPDAPGRPSPQQMKALVQKLLTSRFQLKFHREKRELAVYAISVANEGPKLTEAKEAANAPQAFFFRGLGDLTVRNQTMADFASWMQNGVMDRPVVDQTGLKDRYDFQLKWTPDDSQFAQFRSAGVTVPKPSDAANAPPNLYTAIKQQLGLQMKATKAMDDVIVIDHVDHPSGN